MNEKEEKTGENRVLAFCLVDFDLNIKLSKFEEAFYKINIEKLNQYDKTFETLLESEELYRKSGVNIRSFLGNMMVYMNKTSKVPNIIDLISLNSLTVENDRYPLLKKKLFTFLQEDLNSVVDLRINYSKSVNFKLSNEEKAYREIKLDYFKSDNKLLTEEVKFENLDQLIDHLGGEDNSHKEVVQGSIVNYDELLSSLTYNYSELNYVFIDLNLILSMSRKEEINNFYIFMKTKISPTTSVITFFPKIHNINKDNSEYVMWFLSISDITVYDIYDLNAFSKLCDMKLDEKNLEPLFLKEVKKIMKKPCKIGVFFDNFQHKISVLIQESSGLVLYHKDFLFDFKKSSGEYVYDTILRNCEYFKGVFFGGFFSKVVKKKSYEIAFEAGCEIVRRMVKLLEIGNFLPLDKSYYVVLVSKKKKKKKGKEKDDLTKMKESNFVLDCTNSNSSRLKPYNPLYDNHLSTFFSSNVIKSHLKKQKFINKKGFILDDPDSKSIDNRLAKGSKVSKIQSEKTPELLTLYHEEQNRLLSIKDSNERMKLQLNHLFSDSTKVNEKDIASIGKLPKLKNIEKLAGKKLPCVDWSKNPLTTKPKSSKLLNKTENNFRTKPKLEQPHFHEEESIRQNRPVNIDNNLVPLSKQNFEKFLKLFEEKTNHVTTYSDNLISRAKIV